MAVSAVIGLLLRVRGLPVGRIDIGLGLVGGLLMGGGFGRGLILRGLCGLLVGFCPWTGCRMPAAWPCWRR